MSPGGRKLSSSVEEPNSRRVATPSVSLLFEFVNHAAMVCRPFRVAVFQLASLLQQSQRPSYPDEFFEDKK
jgi:hypothetical protein